MRRRPTAQHRQEPAQPVYRHEGHRLGVRLDYRSARVHTAERRSALLCSPANPSQRVYLTESLTGPPARPLEVVMPEEEAEGSKEILLETINPADLTPDDLKELADQLSAAIPEFDFIPAYEYQHGAGVSWHEVLRLWVENEEMLRDVSFGFVLERVYENMRERFKKPAGKHRPKSIKVNDRSSGKEVKSVVLESADSAPVEVEVDIRIRLVPPKRND